MKGKLYFVEGDSNKYDDFFFIHYPDICICITEEKDSKEWINISEHELSFRVAITKNITLIGEV